MVNSFLVCADYSESARCIDNSRLWKQVLEAWQILRVLEQAHLIAKWMGWPTCPKAIDNNEDSYAIACNYLERCKWLATVRSLYLATETRYVIQEGKVQLRPKDHLPIHVDKYQVCGDHVHTWIPNSDYEKVKSKTLNIQCLNISIALLKSKFKTRTFVTLLRCYVSFGEDRVFNLGYAQHPVAAMWIGYEPSLIDYIQAHHAECIRRGINAPPLVMPEFSGPNIVPWWIRKTEVVFYTHRASLFRKNSNHYQFLASGIRDFNAEYVWPPKLTAQEIVSLIRPNYILEDDRIVLEDEVPTDSKCIVIEEDENEKDDVMNGNEKEVVEA